MSPNEASKVLKNAWKDKAENLNSLYKVPLIGSTFVLADNPEIIYQNTNVICEANSKNAKQIKKRIEEAAKNWRSLGIIPPWEG